MMTFEQFQATRRESDDLARDVPDQWMGDADETRAGLIYDGDTYIERDGDTYTLTLYNQSWATPNLAELERRLYTWAILECPEDMGVTVDAMPQLIDALIEGEEPHPAQTRAGYEANIAAYVNDILSRDLGGCGLPLSAVERIKAKAEKWADRFNAESTDEAARSAVVSHRLTDVPVPAAGAFAFARVVYAMDYLDSLYGPQDAADYIATCEALRAELAQRITNARGGAA